MSVLLAAVYPPQFIANGAAAKLPFTTGLSVLNGLSVVPSGAIVILTSLFVVNIDTVLHNFKLWRGTVAADVNYLMAGPIYLPPASVNYPGIQVLTAPIVLMSGDAIWGLADAANKLTIQGDGQVIVQ